MDSRIREAQDEIKFGIICLNDGSPDTPRKEAARSHFQRSLSLLTAAPYPSSDDEKLLREFIQRKAEPDYVASYLIDALDRLASTPKALDPCEPIKCSRCGDPIRVGICENCDTSAEHEPCEEARYEIEKQVRAEFAKQATDTIPKLKDALDGWIRAGWSTKHMAGDLLRFWLPDRSQVADKREDKLRAALDRANATLEEVASQRNRAMEDVETLREALKRLYRSYVNMMETARDRIISYGGSCDPVDIMVAQNHDLKEASEALSATEPKTWLT